MNRKACGGKVHYKPKNIRLFLSNGNDISPPSWIEIEKDEI